jgi:hypothetical protein
MDEEKTMASYEEFQEAASGYGEEKEGHDLLTDPHAVTTAKARAEAASHGQKLRAARKARITAEFA